MAELHLVLLLLQVPSILAICSFPDFLTSIPYWEGQIQNEHYRPDQLLTFKGDTMRMNVYWPSYKVRFLKCHSALKNDRYIVVDTSQGQPTFKCVQFLKRSAYVMQLAESRISKVDDPAICQDEALQLSPWPYLYPVLRDVYVDCPRIGGYDMYLYSFDDDTLVSRCNPFIPARLESECMPGEGMVFHFQHHDCVDGWSLNINQEALCLGSWTDDNFTFVVLHDKSDYFAKIWMLRLPSTPSEYFRAYLIKDIVADTNITIAREKRENYIAINMKRRVMKSLCEDESPKCNNSCTSDVMRNYCFKSCKVCDETRLPNCTMRNDSFGLWYDSSISGSKYINITNDTLYIDKMPPLKCIDLSQGYSPRDSGYRSLVSVFDNGCRPRFSCGSFERHSNSIQHFKLSQPMSPTATSIMLTGDVCFPLNFRPDTTPLKNFYRSTNKKSLVIVPPPPARRDLVVCGLQGPLDINVTYPSGINCTARILNCNLTKSIVWQTDPGCAEPGPRRVVYNCLASYSTLTKAFIITERQEDKTDLHCWVYNDDVYKNIPNKLFLMRPSDCNPQSMNDIQYSGMQIYVSKVSFQFSQFSSTKECAGVVPPVQEPVTREETTETSTKGTSAASEESNTSARTIDNQEVRIQTTEVYQTGHATVSAFTESIDETDTIHASDVPSISSISDDMKVTAANYVDDKVPSEQGVLGSANYPSTIQETMEPTEGITEGISKAMRQNTETSITEASTPDAEDQSKSNWLQSSTEETVTMTVPNVFTTESVTVSHLAEEAQKTESEIMSSAVPDTTAMEPTAEANNQAILGVTEANKVENTETFTSEMKAETTQSNKEHETVKDDKVDTNTEQSEAVTESMTLMTSKDMEEPVTTDDGTSLKKKDGYQTTRVPNSSLSVDSATVNVKMEGTSENPQLREMSTESHQSDGDVTTEMPQAKPPNEKMANASTPSGSAQMSEVISLETDVQVLNTTVINMTSDKISAGTQPTKFRVAKGDRYKRPGNSIQMSSVASVSSQTTLSTTIIFLAIMCYSIQFCISFISNVTS